MFEGMASFFSHEFHGSEFIKKIFAGRDCIECHVNGSAKVINMSSIIDEFSHPETPDEKSVHVSQKAERKNISRRTSGDVLIYTASQTSYSVVWLPPVFLNRTFEPGSTVPIKFALYDALGNFVVDEAVVLRVYNPYGEEIFNISVNISGNGSKYLRINSEEEYYIANFKTTGGDYFVVVETEEKTCLTCHSVQRNKVFGTIDEVAYSKSTHSKTDILPETAHENESCIACHYNTTGMGGGFIVRLYNGFNSGINANNGSQVNTYYCSVCHFTNWTRSGRSYVQVVSNVTSVGAPPKIIAHTPYFGTEVVASLDGNVRATFAGGRTPACESCHNNSVAKWNVEPISLLSGVSHYTTTDSLLIAGKDSGDACDACHTNYGGLTPEERAKWGIGNSREEGLICCPTPEQPELLTMGWGGYLSQSGVWLGNGICLICHSANTLGMSYSQWQDPTMLKAPRSFHDGSITRNSITRNWYPCASCHG